MVSIQPHSQVLQIHVLAAYFTIELSKDRSGVQSRKQSDVGNGLGTSLVCLKVDLSWDYMISYITATVFQL